MGRNPELVALSHALVPPSRSALGERLARTVTNVVLANSSASALSAQLARGLADEHAGVLASRLRLALWRLAVGRGHQWRILAFFRRAAVEALQGGLCGLWS